MIHAVRHLVAILLLAGLASRAQAGPVELRDIALTTSGSTALVTFSVSGEVKTVVLDRKDGGVAQVRIRSITAGTSALNSALARRGVLSVRAHIERRDVLVTNIAFTRAVRTMSVIQRDDEKIVVKIGLGDPIRGSSGPATASSPSGKSSKTSSRRETSGATADGTKERIRFPLPDGVSLESKRKWSLTTIVIDPGHGGKDPGAIGIDGVKEKDVTLAVARKLRAEIRKKMPEIEVVMTRADDTFIELYRRGQIANQAGGRLFISIHCNSMPSKPHPATGFECYILRPGKSDDAARVAAAENSAIRFESNRMRYAKMATESAIVASMAQSAFVRYSERLAKAVRGALADKTSIPDRGVHQAGFFVLVGASMPAMLLELGYLSNESDVEHLTDEAEQTRIAKGIFEGIKEYEKIYSASLK